MSRFKVSWTERHVAVVLADDKEEAFEKAVNMTGSYVSTEDENSEIEAYDYSKGETDHDRKFYAWEDE